MSETTKAVFLSYASQDAEAARRICEALRSGGVEVWFDADGGLEHGDEWDAKIRRQIKECVLFIPVISANTQAREEGYFRIEWDLAAERARGIASGVPFILPVVIDDTREPEALVPDRFRAVQWTRLRGGDVPTEVRQRFLKLWSHRTGVLKQQAADHDAAPAAALSSAPVPNRKPGAKPYPLIAVAVVAFAATLGWWLLRGRKTAHLSQPAVPAELKTAPAAAPLSEARQLVAKARPLFEGLDVTREDFAFAEDLLKQAVAKDGADADVWAACSELHQRYIVRGWDVTDQRREAAQTSAQRALRIDPGSYEARFAQIGLSGDSPRELTEAERALRALRPERPDDHRLLQALGGVVRKLNRQDEASAIYDEAAALPGGDPLALYDKALDMWFVGRTTEAEAAIKAAIAQKPFSSALLMSGWFKMILHGDLDGALTDLNQAPAWVFREDRGCFFAFVLHVCRREPDAALAALRASPRDWLNDNWHRGPKGELAGDALKLGGRDAAAIAEWRAALKLVESRLATASTDPHLVYNRVMLLAKLGERGEAERQFALLAQLAGFNPADSKPMPFYFADPLIALGRHHEAIQVIRQSLKLEAHAVNFPSAALRLDPTWDPLRSDPEFTKVIAEAEAVEKGTTLSMGTNRTPDEKSVAVLAFANLSDDKGNEYFSDGISEELLTVLQKIPGLHVAARTSAFSFKGKNATAQEIGTTLKVAHLVEGSVQKSGNRVKITARLSRAATGEELWSKSFPPRELTDAFAAESEIALAIVAELRGRLAGDATAQAVIEAQVQAAEIGGTKKVEARQLYLQGKFFANQFNGENVRRAEELLQRAVELDPQFAQAWAALARTASIDAGYADTRGAVEAANALARRASDRALALAPGLAAARRRWPPATPPWWRAPRTSRTISARSTRRSPSRSRVWRLTR